MSDLLIKNIYILWVIHFYFPWWTVHKQYGSYLIPHLIGWILKFGYCIGSTVISPSLDCTWTCSAEYLSVLIGKVWKLMAIIMLVIFFEKNCLNTLTIFSLKKSVFIINGQSWMAQNRKMIHGYNASFTDSGACWGKNPKWRRPLNFLMFVYRVSKVIPSLSYL